MALGRGGSCLRHQRHLGGGSAVFCTALSSAAMTAEVLSEGSDVQTGKEQSPLEEKTKHELNKGQLGRNWPQIQSLLHATQSQGTKRQAGSSPSCRAREYPVQGCAGGLASSHRLLSAPSAVTASSRTNLRTQRQAAVQKEQKPRAAPICGNRS